MITLRSLNIHERNTRILNGLCQILIQHSTGLGQNLAGLHVHHIFRQSLSLQAVFKMKLFIKLVSSDLCQIISSGIKKHTVEQALRTVHGKRLTRADLLVQL